MAKNEEGKRKVPRDKPKKSGGWSKGERVRGSGVRSPKSVRSEIRRPGSSTPKSGQYTSRGPRGTTSEAVGRVYKGSPRITSVRGTTLPPVGRVESRPLQRASNSKNAEGARQQFADRAAEVVAERAAKIKAFTGKYAYVRTSSEEFAARKQEEIEREL